MSKNSFSLFISLFMFLKSLTNSKKGKTYLSHTFLKCVKSMHEIYKS